MAIPMMDLEWECTIMQILLPGMILWPPPVDNSQYLERDGKSW